MSTPHGSTPLVVSADELLVADVLRLAAAAGVSPEVCRTATGALPAWARAPMVLVGGDLAAELADLAPVRRPGVQVIAVGEVPDALFRHALRLGAETVAALPASETWLVELLTDLGDGAAPAGTTLGVVGGCGGAGATVLACALAMHAARAGGALLVDADPLGPGVDRVLGLESAEGVRWDSMMQATGRLSARSLRDALPARDGLSVLTWPVDRELTLQAFAVREVLSAGRRGFGQVVVDLPRHRDRVVDEIIARCDRLLLVSPLTVPAIAASARVSRRLAAAGRPVQLVLRGGGGVAASEASGLLGLPVLATMPDQRGLDESVNLGAGPVRTRRGPLARAARACLESLAAGDVAA
jgi:secretion/DNA translocation related CpaE-like protein